MKSRDTAGAAQSGYLLEYGRRKIRVCADTFQNLAQIFGEDEEEAQGEDGADARQARAVYMMRKRLAEGRQLFAGNLKEMADMMNHVADESVRFISLGNRRQKQIMKGLLGEGLVARDIYLVQKGDGRMELSILLSTKGRASRTVEEAADYLSVLLDMRLMSARRNPFFIGQDPVCFFFEEEPFYCYMTGTARAAKETEEVSGDNFAFFEADDGNFTIVLSDGMGSGEEACRDSEAVADMTETMLEAGLPLEMAVQLVNSAVASEGKEGNMPTLDLCSVDLYEGSCRFMKTGAAASFIKRGSIVEKIDGGTLPLGAFGHAQPRPAECQLMDGDYIIMLSDGMTEGWPGEDGEERLETLLGCIGSVSPAEIANTMMKYAIEQCQGRIRDDMTVLAAGIWERNREWQSEQ